MIATIGRFFYLQTIAVFSSGRLSLHPIREQGFCKSRLNVLAQIACLRLRSAG